MYISDEFKVQWWLPPRTASRMTAEILRKLNFEVYGNHHLFNENPSVDSKIILNVRNPYSIIVSRYKQFYKKNISTSYTYEWGNFNDFIKTFIRWFNEHRNYGFYNYPEIFNKSNTKPYFRVRYEHFIDDLLSVDVINNNKHLIQDELEKLNLGKLTWSENSLLDTSIPYHQHYNQESADLVYDLFENIFIFDGYERDSWKTITI